MSSLLSLPVEVLHDIHLLSTSEHLPLVCKKLLHVYTNTTSDRYKAIFLWRKYPLIDYVRPSSKARRVDGKASKFKSKRWDKILSNRACSIQALRILKKFQLEDTPLNERESQKVRIRRIPTRLFKPLSIGPDEHFSFLNRNQAQLDYCYQYIDILLSEFGASPDKIGGYPLARSVLSGNVKFIRLLLTHGARPETNNNLATRVAIETGNLEILRLLIEPGYIHPHEAHQVNIIHSRKNPLPHFHVNFSRQILPNQSPKEPRKKKIRLEDRVRVTDQMLEESVRRRDPSIFQYLLEKGAKPTLTTIRLIESMNIAWSFF